MKDLVDAFSGLTFEALGKLVLAFLVIDIARKLVIPKIVERVLARGFGANETARLALVDILGFLRRAELMAQSLLDDDRALRPEGSDDRSALQKVQDFGDLASIGSEYRLVAPSLSRDKLLDAFADEEIQRCAITMFDCYQRFSIRSQDNRQAFYWLLDNHDVWLSRQVGACAQIRERLTLLNDARDRMLTYLFEILATGYRLSELLCAEASSAWTLRHSFEGFERVLRSLHALDSNGIRLRRAFYAVRNRREILREHRPLSLIRWNDEVARKEPDALAEIWVSSRDTSRFFRLPAMTEVALPAGTIPAQDVLIRRKRRLDERRTLKPAITLTETPDHRGGVRDIELFPSQ